MLDLHKLHIFATVADEGSFSAGANRLYVSQSAVSQQMRELEAGLGVALFVRGRRGVTLTDGGRTLYGYARRLLALAAEAESALTSHSSVMEGQLVIGATPGASVYLLPEIIQAFRVQYPAATIQLQTGVTSFILDELRARRMELGLIEGELEVSEVERFEVVALAEVEQYVIVGSRHGWWGRQEIAISDLADQVFIMRPRDSHTRTWLDRVLVNHGIRPNISAEFDNVESIKRAVAAGTCVSVLPRYVVEQEERMGILQCVAILGRPLLRTLKLVRDMSTPLSALADGFSQRLKQRNLLPP